MSYGTVSAQYPGVAHGALNWDAQLRADVSALTDRVNKLMGEYGQFSYAGSVVDYGSNWITYLFRYANSVTFNLGVNPGSNGLSAGGGNNFVGQIPSGFTPLRNHLLPVSLSTNSGAERGVLQVNTDGTVRVNWLSANAVGGTLMAGQLTYQIA